MLRERSCREGGRGGLIEPPQGLQGASPSTLRLADAPYYSAWGLHDECRLLWLTWALMLKLGLKLKLKLAQQFPVTCCMLWWLLIRG